MAAPPAGACPDMRAGQKQAPDTDHSVAINCGRKPERSGLVYKDQAIGLGMWRGDDGGLKGRETG